MLVLIRFPVFKTKIETQHLGEWISPLFQAENQGRTKNNYKFRGCFFQAAPKFIIVFLFDYNVGVNVLLSLSLLRRVIDGILEMVCLNLHLKKDKGICTKIDTR